MDDIKSGFPSAAAFVISIILSVCVLAACPSHSAAAINIKVTVGGVKGDLKTNVLAFLSIARQKEHPDLTPGLARKLHEKAPDEIRSALQPFGYYNPSIQSELTQEGEAWHATYMVEPGAPVIIEHIDVSVTGEGAADEKFRALEESLPLKEGDVLNHQRYEEAKRMFHDTAARNGYVRAEMTESRVEVYPEKNIARITLHFQTEARYYFGEVEFIQDTFDPEFLSRLVPFKRGDPYSMSGLMELQNTLNDSDYFESVDVVPLFDEAAELEVPVRVTVIPLKRNKYTFGIGYGTDTGVRGSIGWEDRRVNRNGHRMKAGLRLAEIRSSLTGEYTVPLTHPRTDNMVYAAGWLSEDTQTSKSEKLFGGVRYNHVRNGWKESVYTNYEHERFSVGEDSGRSVLLIPGTSWTRTNAGAPGVGSQGSRVFLDIRGAHEALLSDTSFLQLRMQVKYIFGVTSLSRLILRGEGGGSLVDDFFALPPSVRFFAGGDNSVRGYAYNSLGPEDDEGNVTGGRHLLVGSIEFEHQIVNKWSAAVFYDAGNAINSISDALKKGAGFGVRWRSPVGPVRVDLAFPLDEAERSWRVHLIIGPDL